MDPRDKRILDLTQRIGKKAKSKGFTPLVMECESFRKICDSTRAVATSFGLHLLIRGLQLDNDAIAEEAFDCISSLVVTGAIVGNDVLLREVPPSSAAFGRAMNVVIVHAVHEAFAMYRSEKVQRKAIECLVTTAVTPLCCINETLLLRTVQTFFNAVLMTTSSSVVVTAQRALRRTLCDCLLDRLMVPPPPTSPTHLASLLLVPTTIPREVSEKEVCDTMLTAAERDFFVVFRSLCMLCQTPISPGSNDLSIDIRTRIAALELVQVVLRYGTVLPQCVRLMACCQNYLFRALFDNLSATQPAILFESAILIVQIVIIRYRSSLRFAIEEYFRVLRLVLLSPFAPFHHKAVTIKCVTKIVLTEGLVIELFTNHDCQVNHDDVVATLMNTLFEFALKRWEKDPTKMGYSAAQHVLLRRLGMDALRSSLLSIHNWVIDGHRRPTTTHPPPTPTLSFLRMLKSHKNKMRQGVGKLNEDWKVGLRVLEQLNVLPPNDPTAFASLLRHVADVHLETTKEVFAQLKKKSFCADVVRAYVRTLPLSGVHVDVACAVFTGTFPVSSNSAQFEGPVWMEIMATFGAAYAEQNPGLLLTDETGDTLCSTVLTLHTTNHNKNINPDHRFTEDRFVKAAMECMASCPTMDETVLRDVFHRVNAAEWPARTPPITYAEGEVKIPFHTTTRFLEDEQVVRVLYAESVQGFQRCAESRVRAHASTPVPPYMEASTAEQATDALSKVASTYLAALNVTCLNDMSADLAPVMGPHQLAAELLLDVTAHLGLDMREVVAEASVLAEGFQNRSEVRLGRGGVMGALWLGALQIHTPFSHR